MIPDVSPGIARRSLLPAVIWPLTLMGCRPQSVQDPMASLAPLVQPLAKWHEQELANFLQALPPAAMLAVQQTIGMVSAQDDAAKLQGPTVDTLAVQIRLQQLSSHFFKRAFKKPGVFDYHDMMKWVADRSGVASNVVQNASSYGLERKLLELVFIEQWDRLSMAQREEVLQKLDSGMTSNKAAIAALGGAGALAALSTTVALSGFAFYSGLSTTIAAVAAAAGATAPFAVYTSASTIVAVLSGPVGWAIGGMAALGGLTLLGRPNARHVISFVSTLHLLKVQALKAAGLTTEIT